MNADALLAAVCAAPDDAPRLVYADRLEEHGCGLTGDGLRALRPLLAEGRIRTLSLEHNVFDYDDARDLAAWPELCRLHELHLGYFNHVGDAGLKALEDSPNRHPHSRYG